MNLDKDTKLFIVSSAVSVAAVATISYTGPPLFAAAFNSVIFTSHIFMTWSFIKLRETKASLKMCNLFEEMLNKLGQARP